MSDPFVGEIRMMGFNFAPLNWAACNGQIIAISQNSALFSILGTTFGGNGTSNFALPNLIGNVPLGQGQAPGLSDYLLGETGGQTTVTLTQSQIGTHSHTVTANDDDPLTKDPTNGYIADAATNIYTTNPGNATLAGSAITPAGGNQPHDNQQPYLAVNFCIALYGVYPPRG